MRILLSILVLLATAMLLSCNAEPEPIKYGEDVCYHCKMTLMDEKFGNEVLTKKGKVYKFDDMDCLVGFLNSGELAEENIKQILVVDFAKRGHLIPAENAVFLVAPHIQSPMGSQTAAFSDREAALSFNAGQPSFIKTWAGIKLKP